MLKPNLFHTLRSKKRNGEKQRALVAGWFSYPDKKATFGDEKAKDVVCEWLSNMGIPFDVAGNKENRVAGVNINEIDPKHYTIFIFVCGPWQLNKSILGNFQHCIKVGINLSISNIADHGFDYLLPRDTPSIANPDIVFAAQTSMVPVCGVIFVHPQPMYGDRQRHSLVQKIITEYVETKNIVPLYLDTLLVNNHANLRDFTQFETLLKRVDFVISTRLHGMVFSLKNEIPVIAIDPIAGGAKVTAQANALGWPLLINGEDLTFEKLDNAVRKCLDKSLSKEIAQCRTNASSAVFRIRDEFIDILSSKIS